jgi:hypothetical protein
MLQEIRNKYREKAKLFGLCQEQELVNSISFSSSKGERVRGAKIKCKCRMFYRVTPILCFTSAAIFWRSFLISRGSIPTWYTQAAEGGDLKKNVSLIRWASRLLEPFYLYSSGALEDSTNFKALRTSVLCVYLIGPPLAESTARRLCSVGIDQYTACAFSDILIQLQLLISREDAYKAIINHSPDNQ